jgi:Photoprotection regulator fluorescence recovery protein
MQVTDTEWSQTEQDIAQAAFNKAYDREINALIKEINEKASVISHIEDIWGLHDYLSARRHDIDGKYDYRHSVLIFVFARLLKEGWLQLDELEGLEASKIRKVTALSRM